MTANGKVNKNKVIPVQLATEEDETVEENRGAQACSPENAEEKESPNLYKKVRMVSPLKSAGQAKLNVSKWRKYARRRTDIAAWREHQKARIDFPTIRESQRQNHQRINAAQLSDLEELVEITSIHQGHRKDGGVTAVSSPSRALLYYFAKLAASTREEEVIDLEFVETLIQNGASVNTADRHGQTLMHEAARQWDLSVAKLLLERGASINQADKYGRTPLHVAAAVDYPEMVHFLVQRGADIHAKTGKELQTPIHFAARNDATSSLKMLMKCGACITDKDFKQRTALQVAAELDRSETAKCLVERSAEANVADDSGMTALVMMISKMPSVAKEALNQFYSTDRANRKQYFYLNYLEPPVPTCMSSGCARTALEVIVQLKQFDLIMHPVIQRLIKVKWNYFGKRGAWIQVVVNLFFVLVWTVLGITTPSRAGELYEPIKEKWWRITLSIIGVLMTLNFIRQEVMEYFSSKREHRLWVKWREDKLRGDLEFCHPRWPGERLYLMQEIDSLHHQEPAYFKDAWNFVDWLAYFMILASIATNLIAYLYGNTWALIVHVNISSATLVILWIRLMKYARAFTSLGPFVVMLGHVINDILKFGFLFFTFYIPYAASFWMVFSGHQVEGYSDITDLLYSMFRMTVVDEYNYDGLEQVKPMMAKVLCGTYIAISGVICLNLFIALMSDTFQRVYDNVKANAVMQQATTILTLEKSLSASKRRAFTNFIYTRCNPEELYYDDDLSEGEEKDLQRMTHQIKEQVDHIYAHIAEQDSDRKKKGTASTNDVHKLREDLKKLEQQHRALTAQFHNQIGEVKDMLGDIIHTLGKRKKKKH